MQSLIGVLRKVPLSHTDRVDSSIRGALAQLLLIKISAERLCRERVFAAKFIHVFQEDKHVKDLCSITCPNNLTM